MSDNPITDLLAEITTLNSRYDAADTEQLRGQAAGPLVQNYRELHRLLSLRAYPLETEHDRLEQVVVTVHGLDISVRGRTYDVFVHIDNDERDADDMRRYVLAVEVDNGGEATYGDPHFI
jgi:hypothetical protein